MNVHYPDSSHRAHVRRDALDAEPRCGRDSAFRYRAEKGLDRGHGHAEGHSLAVLTRDGGAGAAYHASDATFVVDDWAAYVCVLEARRQVDGVAEELAVSSLHRAQALHDQARRREVLVGHRSEGAQRRAGLAGVGGAWDQAFGPAPALGDQQREVPGAV